MAIMATASGYMILGILIIFFTVCFLAGFITFLCLFVAERNKCKELTAKLNAKSTDISAEDKYLISTYRSANEEIKRQVREILYTPKDNKDNNEQ